MPGLSRDEIIHLSPPERLALIGDLWDSLADADTPLPLAQEQELSCRLAVFEEERSTAVTWEQLKAELARRTP